MEHEKESRQHLTALALGLLRQGGTDAVTFAALAAQSGIKASSLSRSFGDRRILMEELARAVLDEARSSLPDRENWQDWLRHGARALRDTLLRYPDAPSLVAGVPYPDRMTDSDREKWLTPLLRGGFHPDRAVDAMAMVAHYTIGWCMEKTATVPHGRIRHESLHNARFEMGLEVLLAGLAQVEKDRPRSTLPTQRRMVAARLWALLRQCRLSADHAYDRVSGGISELDRRLLIEIASGHLTRSTEFAMQTGLDKAQVSRGVRRLRDHGLIRKDMLRSPLMLTDAGVALAQQLVSIARTRHADLITGISQVDLDDFLSLISEMRIQAILLFEQERAMSQGKDYASAAGEDPYVNDQQPDLLVARLVTLFSYMQRSGALMIRRLTDLSNFEWLLLSTLSEMGPITPARLVSLVERDHSQAQRTLRRLIETGLVRRTALPGQRGRVLELTRKGEEAAALLWEEGLRRDELLYGKIAPHRLEHFLAVLERLNDNATRGLEQEQEQTQEQARDISA